MALSVEVTDRCTGHGQCYQHCPEVFVPDEEGYATIPDPTVVASFTEKVREAAEACPERAITVHGE
jgi:ferredoxin